MIEEFITRRGVLKAGRANWETMWQDIADVIYTQRSDFITKRAPGEKRKQKVFDSTAEHANELLASGFNGMLTNPATEWFQGSINDPVLIKRQEVKDWLFEVTRIIRFELDRPSSGFQTAMHEVYMEFGAFCTGIMFVGENNTRDELRFNARALNEMLLAENADGRVDTFYRDFPYTIKQMIDKWGIKNLPKAAKKKAEKGILDECHEILHVVEPRMVRDKKKIDNLNLEFRSIYIDMTGKEKIEESGFHEQPFMAPRFSRAPGEIYGRGPGTTSLPDARMLQAMMKAVIEGAQKSINPPLIAEDDGVIGPLRTIPGGINYFRRGSAPPQAMFLSGDTRLGMDLIEDVRTRIRENFFVDQLQLNQGPQMTATEVLQRTEEKLRLMSPVLGRIQTELLDPMFDRIFNILSRQGKIPPAPEVIQDKEIRFEYTSPIVRAQKQLELASVERLFNVLAAPLSLEPQKARRFNTDAAVKHLGQDVLGISPELFQKDTFIEEEEAKEAALREANELLATEGQAASNDQMSAQAEASVGR